MTKTSIRGLYLAQAFVNLTGTCLVRVGAVYMKTSEFF